MPIWFWDRRNLLLLGRSILFVALASLIGTSARCTTHGTATIAPIPSEVRSTQFLVTMKWPPHAGDARRGRLLPAQLRLSGPRRSPSLRLTRTFGTVALNSSRSGLVFAQRGGGGTIRFRSEWTTKLTIARPGDHFADAEMLFLFANEPDSPKITPQTPGIRYYTAGVHHESINAQSGDNI